MLSTMIESDPKDASQLTIGTRTWPKAHLSQRSLSDLQYRIQLEKAIKLAQQNLEKAQILEEQSEGQGTCRNITQKLLRALERIRDSKNDQLIAKAGRRRRRESVAAAKNEPHFGSMILFGTMQHDQAKALRRGMAMQKEPGGTRRKSISILSDDLPTDEEAEGIVYPEQLKVQMDGEGKEPLLLRYLPLLTTLFCAFLLLIFGAIVFRMIDAEIAEHPFHRALLFSFQAVATIGWGDIRATNLWSQAFCSLFTVFGVPIYFSALANVGLLISDFYSLDWLFLTCVVRHAGADEPVVQQHISLRKSLYLLCIHQNVGVILYGSLLKNYPPVAVIYFCITSEASIGIGDYHPDATNFLEAIVSIIYLSLGMCCLFALLIAIAYHFQSLFFVHFRDWLLRKIEERK